MIDTKLVLWRLCNLGHDAISYMFPGLELDADKSIKKQGLESLCECDTLPGICLEDAPECQIVSEAQPVVQNRFPAVSESHATAAPQFPAAAAMPDVEKGIFKCGKEAADLCEDNLADARRRKILAAIKSIQEEYGISIEEIEMILSYSVKLSRLRVRDDGRIYLMDYDNAEVKMDPLTKTVFLLFLKHPEGIEYKEIADYRGEIETIYGHISRSGDPAAISRSLDLLCNPVESNSLNEKVSRVKRAFINAKDDRIASHYYINGPAGGIRKISLDRSMVIWG